MNITRNKRAAGLIARLTGTGLSAYLGNTFFGPAGAAAGAIAGPYASEAIGRTAQAVSSVLAPGIRATGGLNPNIPLGAIAPGAATNDYLKSLGL